MNANVLGFLIWAIIGVLIIVIGIIDIFSKKTVGFFANNRPPVVSDIKAYNRAVGGLFIAYGLILIVLGIPLLDSKNISYILLSVIGVMVETIGIIAIYILCIERRYTAKR